MKIIELFFDGLFPPRSSERLVRTLQSNELERKYVLRLVQKTYCLSNYQDPLIQALITENKFYNNRVASVYLATLIEEWKKTQLRPIVFIPVPLSKKRERERGYNQVTVVLETLKRNTSFVIDSTLLHRSRHTIPQTALDREERLKNLSNAFICNREKIKSYENRTLVLVDDVLTTGATLAAVHAELTPHLHPSSSLTCLALAH